VPGPDTIVKQHGETVTHEYVTDYQLDANGQVDPSSVVTESDDIQAVVSQPSEQDQQRVDGRLSTGSLRLTVASDQDVSGERGGRRDRFQVDGEWYEVVEVQADEHPVTGTAKQTVLVDRLGGR
jgi:hypothetical protein